MLSNLFKSDKKIMFIVVNYAGLHWKFLASSLYPGFCSL